MRNERKLGAIVTVVGISAMILTICVADLFAKELPTLVPLDKIGQQYDGHRVSVFGWVRSVAVKRGRMGSKYLEITLGKGDATVNVYSIDPVWNILNQHVIVQGKYREYGKIGGHLVENYITAEVIVRDWQ